MKQLSEDAKQDGFRPTDLGEGDDWKVAPSRETTSDDPFSSNARRAADRRVSENAPLADPARQTGVFTLLSPGFEDGDWLPAAHGADGGSISPPLRWTGLPSEATSLLISLEDMDLPSPHARRESQGAFADVYWLMVNVPPLPPMLAAGAGGEGAGEPPYPERSGTLIVPYRSPEALDEARRYRFVVRALSRPVDEAEAKKGLGSLLASCARDFLGAAELTVRYGRAPSISSVM